MLKIETTRLRVDISSDVYAEVAEPGTRKHAEIVRFQQERFALVGGSSVSATGDATFVETTDYAPEQTVPMGVYRRVPSGTGPDTLIGAARLELPGATVIETMIRLAPGTPAALALERHEVAEVGGFATPLNLDKATLIDVIDACVTLIVRVARQHGVKWLWIFPRKGFMSVMRAHIPGLLPPYRLTYCADWMGWHEQNARYQQFRALRLRGLTDQPLLFQISRDDFASDLTRRIALREARVARASELEGLFLGAMRKAERDITDEMIRRHNETHDFGVTLRNELDLRPGQRILNVDCGAGQNLAWLRERTGTRGVVVGLERDATLVQRARQAIGEADRADMVVFQGASENLAFPDGLFDRIYADRTLQRAEDAGNVLAELGRVLAPGGILSLVMPVWETLEVRTGRFRSEDDAGVLERLLGWYRRVAPFQPDVARLRRAMSTLDQGAWQETRVSETRATFTDLNRVRALLLLPEAQQALAEEDDGIVRQLATFERHMERAARAVSLSVSVALRSVWARRAVLA